MRSSKNIFFLVVSLLFFTVSRAQQGVADIDSLKKALAASSTATEKIYWLKPLSAALIGVDLTEGEKYGQQLIEVAEESRDRRLMAEAYLWNGILYSQRPEAEYIKKSIDHLNTALDIATQNRLDTSIWGALIGLGSMNLKVPDNDKALSYTNQAASIAFSLNSDSLKIVTYLAYGEVYLKRNDKILALRNYLLALRASEESKMPIFIRISLLQLSEFYSVLKVYDKAIDYRMKAYQKLDDMKQKEARYLKVTDLSDIGQLYSKKKNYEIAINYFNRSIAMADSLKYADLKIFPYMLLLMQYLNRDKPKEALDYFNSPPGYALRAGIEKVGLSAVNDYAFGRIYTDMGNYDSAEYYLKKAAPVFENKLGGDFRISYYMLLSKLKKRSGEYDTSIALYLKAKELSDKSGDLESSKYIARELDSLYARTGNFQMARHYNSIYYQYKDSIEAFNKEKELIQEEEADEQLRFQRLAKEKEEEKRKRYNIQYMAITIGIVALFVGLVMLGMFRVSRTTIKMIGFFAFLMFFEFIFLIFKKNIYSITEGEPWKDLLFMIGLAAILLPLHHWLEHKVIHYLTSHNRLTSAGSQLKSRLFKGKKAGNP